MKKTKLSVVIVLVSFICSMILYPAYANAEAAISDPLNGVGKNMLQLQQAPKKGQASTADMLNSASINTDKNSIITSEENGSAPDVQASGDKKLSENGKDIGLIESMGFSTAQPARIAPDGSEVDKKQNPFGSNITNFNGYRSLVAAGIPENKDGKGSNNFFIANNKPDAEGRAFDTFYQYAAFGNNLSDYPRVMTAGDIDGSGYDKVLAAVLTPVYEKDNKTISSYGLELNIVSYTKNEEHPNIQTVKLIPSGINMPGLPTSMLKVNTAVPGFNIDIFPEPSTEEYRTHLKVAACKNKLAVLVNKDLYVYSVTKSGTEYSLLYIGGTSFNTPSDGLPIIDMKANDVNDDGLKELLVTVGSTASSGAELRIYDWESASGTVYPIGKSVSVALDSVKYAAVTVGNVTGERQSIVVGGYKKDNIDIAILSYINYNPKTNTYEKSRDYVVGGGTFDDNKRNCMLPSLDCVYFQVPHAGAAQYIVFDHGYGFCKFSKDGFLTSMDEEVSAGSLNDYNQNLLYLDTMVGHFFTDTTVLQQQMVILAKDRDKNYKMVLVYMNSNTEELEYKIVNSFKGNIVEGAKDSKIKNYNGYYPALCGAHVRGENVSLKYLDASFIMSDPKVVAVLGASPYYDELQDKYGNGWGNVSTDFGTGKAKETGSEHEVNFSVGSTLGFSYEYSAGLIIQQKIFEFEFELNVTDCFTKSWSDSTSIQVSKGFSAMNNDMVVVTSVPYDVYRYQVINPGKPDDGTIRCLYVPYSPQFSEMNMDYYNEMAQQLNHDSGKNVVPKIDKTVLNHTVGDPRSYTSVAGSSGAMKGDGFIGVGIGDGISQQGISKTTTHSEAFTASINVDTTFKLTVGSLITGLNFGVGYSHKMSTSVSASEDFSGAVVNLPVEYKNYYFSWQFIAYKHSFSYGDGTSSQCYVLNYLVKPSSTVPPKPPANIRLVKYSGNSAELTWDRVKGASKYYIYRSASEKIDTSKPYRIIGKTADGNTVTTLTDTGLTPSRQYYYAIASATNTITGMPSSAIAVPLKVKAIEIKTQPRLKYSDGDTLDLSLLGLTFILSDDSSVDMGYKDFFKRGITVSLNDGEFLKPEYNGNSLVVFDPKSGLSDVTEPLEISPSAAKESSGLNVETYFTVGSVEHAVKLTPNSLLVSHTTIKNNGNSEQPVVIVTARYDDDTMVEMDCMTRTILPNETVKLDMGNFTLPADISGSRVKVFVLEGSSLQNSSMRPVVNPAEIR